MEPIANPKGKGRADRTMELEWEREVRDHIHEQRPRTSYPILFASRSIFRFLDLPAEIRQMIYDDFFDRVVIEACTLNIDQNYIVRHQLQKNRSLIESCRLVRHEALPLYTEKLVLGLNIHDYVLSPRASDIESLLRKRPLRRIRNISLNTIIPGSSDVTHFNTFARKACIQLPSLEEIHFETGPSCSVETNWLAPWTAFASDLDDGAISRLRRVAVTSYQTINFRRTDMTSASWKAHLEIIKEDFAKVFQSMKQAMTSTRFRATSTPTETNSVNSSQPDSRWSGVLWTFHAWVMLGGMGEEGDNSDGFISYDIMDPKGLSALIHDQK
ncbi:hypothetical protein MMC25_006849 [Agyrium rufum]|nr:hypothetical protein [Agyrium rufum]